MFVRSFLILRLKAQAFDGGYPSAIEQCRSHDHFRRQQFFALLLPSSFFHVSATAFANPL